MPVTLEASHLGPLAFMFWLHGSHGAWRFFLIHNTSVIIWHSTIGYFLLLVKWLELLERACRDEHKDTRFFPNIVIPLEILWFDIDFVDL